MKGMSDKKVTLDETRIEFILSLGKGTEDAAPLFLPIEQINKLLQVKALKFITREDSEG